jgi:hypothetical protein
MEVHGGGGGELTMTGLLIAGKVFEREGFASLHTYCYSDRI